MVPYRFCFDVTEISPAILDLELAQDIYFMADVLINLNTGYFDIDSKELQLDRCKIIKKYMIFWFWFDMMTSVPWEKLFKSSMYYKDSNTLVSFYIYL